MLLADLRRDTYGGDYLRRDIEFAKTLYFLKLSSYVTTVKFTIGWHMLTQKTILLGLSAIPSSLG